MNNQLLRERIAGCKKFPNLPRQAHRLLQTFASPDLAFNALPGILSDHPTITARLIALANSAWAAPVTPINSLERACVKLGFTVVRSVSIGLAVISPFNISACPAFDIHRFWTSSKLVADAAVLLASARPPPPDQSFMQTLHTGGLLHNLGLICLADLMPEETHQALLRVTSTPGLTVNQALYQSMQTDFCAAGGLFAEIWGLPDNLTAIIKFHCAADYPDRYWEYIALIANAAAMVSALFSNQPELPMPIATDKLGISDADYQQVFEKLPPLFLQTKELAKALF